MSDYDFDRAVKSFEELSREFKRAGNLYPNLRHRLVEAPRERLPEFRGMEPACASCYPSSSGYFRTYFESHPQPRGHHYTGIDQDEDGADLEAFQGLAERAFVILNGCSAPTPLLMAVLDTTSTDCRSRPAESWMALVHRLAWQEVPGQQLITTPSTPDIEAQTSPLYTFVNIGIPPDCSASNLPNVSVFQCCAWAIDLIVGELKNAASSPATMPAADEPSLVVTSDTVPDLQTTEKPKKKKNKQENTNKIVAGYLIDHPKAAIGEVKRETKCSQGSIQKTPAWKAKMDIQRKKRGERVSVRTIQETKEFTHLPDESPDPQDIVDCYDELEVEYMKVCSDKEKKEYRKLPPDERHELIALYQNQKTDDESRKFTESSCERSQNDDPIKESDEFP